MAIKIHFVNNNSNVTSIDKVNCSYLLNSVNWTAMKQIKQSAFYSRM